MVEIQRNLQWERFLESPLKKELWWGRPDLNRRPLPNNGEKPKFTGFFKTAPELYHSPEGVSKPELFLEPVVLACLDYNPTLILHRYGKEL